MAKRRARGTGGIHPVCERKGPKHDEHDHTGCKIVRWIGQVENGHYPNGRRRRARIVRKTQAEVIEAMGKRRPTGGRGLDGSMRLDAFLDAWLEQLATVGGRSGRPVADATVRKYTWSAQRIKAERIGKMRLRDIRPRDVQTLIGACRRELADTSVSDVKTALAAALAWAVLNDQIATNPAREVTVHQSKRAKTDDAFTPAEQDVILAAADGAPWGIAAQLGLRYGMRIGEVCAARWSDVGADVIRIRRTSTKSDAGAGKLPLLPEVADALKARRRFQAAEQLKAGALWIGSDYIITGPRGGPVDPATLRRWWNGWLAGLGIAHRCLACDDDETPCSTAIRRFHACRHSTASRLIADGVPDSIVQAVLRHANLSTTVDTYTHIRNDKLRSTLATVAHPPVDAARVLREAGVSEDVIAQALGLPKASGDA